MSFPSNLKTVHNLALQRRSAVAAIVSNTGWVSAGELEITRRISEVAVCCSRASASRFSASANRSSRSRTLEVSLSRGLGAAGRLASIFAFEGFEPRRMASPYFRRVTIVQGVDD